MKRKLLLIVLVLLISIAGWAFQAPAPVAYSLVSGSRDIQPVNEVCDGLWDGTTCLPLVFTSRVLKGPVNQAAIDAAVAACVATGLSQLNCQSAGMKASADDFVARENAFLNNIPPDVLASALLAADLYRTR